MATESRRRAVAKYDSENTVKVTLKLNRKTDADILCLLESVGNKQGFIKSVLRERLLIERQAGFYYGMRLRGFSPGCQPKDGFLRQEDDPTGKYHDIIVYDRRLSEDEIRHYDLDDLN